MAQAEDSSGAPALAPVPAPLHVSRTHMLLATLQHLRAPRILMELVVALLRAQQLRVVTRPSLQFVELFSGDGAVTRAMQDRGLLACPYDVRLDPLHNNFLTDLGFMHALLLVLQLQPGGGLLCATVCSTWTAVNAGTARRSKSRPLGEERHPSVRAGNLMATRTALVLFLAHAVGAVPFAPVHVFHVHASVRARARQSGGRLCVLCSALHMRAACRCGCWSSRVDRCCSTTRGFSG